MDAQDRGTQTRVVAVLVARGREVDRFRLFGTAACVAVATACAAPHAVIDRSDFLAEGTRTYNGQPRERIIEAAQFVLKYSDPQDFEFRDNLTGFVGLRRFVVYAVVAAAVGREKWEFTTEPHGAGVRASVNVSEAGQVSGSYSSAPFEGRMASVALYRLFWNRVDYMLGRRPDWVSCEHAVAALQATNTNSTAALGGLCGPTSDGRTFPPPAPLEPLPAFSATAAPLTRVR